MTQENAGSLGGEVNVTLQTEDAVGLFDGYIPKRVRKDAMTLDIKKFSIRTVLVIRAYLAGDPVAQEILVNTEAKFAELDDFTQKLEAKLVKLKESQTLAISSTTKSSEPAVRDCSRFNRYGMLAVKTLTGLDEAIKLLIEAHHLTYLSTDQMESDRRNLKRRFRSAMTPVFLYKRSATRKDFDSCNENAKAMIKHYRRTGYIYTQDDRTDEQIAEHYAYYDDKPQFSS